MTENHTENGCKCPHCNPTPEMVRAMVERWSFLLRNLGIPEASFPKAATEMDRFMASQYQAILDIVGDWITRFVGSAVESMHEDLPEPIVQASVAGMLSMVSKIRSGEPIRWNQDQRVAEMAQKATARKVEN